MRARLLPLLVAAAAGAALLGSGAAVLALWRDSDSRTVPSIMVGNVAFGAYGESGPTAADNKQHSPDGTPVTLTLPGSVIVKLLDQTRPDPDPVFWQFTVDGWAKGSAGMNYDVAVTNQRSGDDVVASLVEGLAKSDTLLAKSTMKVYPAQLNGDCSSIPDTPEGPAKNVYLYDYADLELTPAEPLTDHVLQDPGIYDEIQAATTQLWCVAITYDSPTEGRYTNEVQAVGASPLDAYKHSALARWESVVVFRPSFDPLGQYINRVDVTATAEDGTTSNTSDLYQANVYPDPSGEPDVTITLTPKVT